MNEQMCKEYIDKLKPLSSLISSPEEMIKNIKFPIVVIGDCHSFYTTATIVGMNDKEFLCQYIADDQGEDGWPESQALLSTIPFRDGEHYFIDSKPTEKQLAFIDKWHVNFDKDNWSKFDAWRLIGAKIDEWEEEKKLREKQKEVEGEDYWNDWCDEADFF